MPTPNLTTKTFFFADWKIEKNDTLATHKSGLSIELQRAPKAKGRKSAPSLDILGLTALNGTEWAAKSNLLIEQGIFLLERQRATATLA